MALTVPNDGEEIILQNFLNKVGPQDQKLRLYKTTDVTISETSVTADFTEATFTGYAEAALSGASWTITPGAPSSASYAQQTFTSSADQAAQVIYGYYVVQTTSGKLLWAERFTDGPYTIANNGDAIKVTPNFTMA